MPTEDEYRRAIERGSLREEYYRAPCRRSFGSHLLGITCGVVIAVAVIHLWNGLFG